MLLGELVSNMQDQGKRAKAEITKWSHMLELDQKGACRAAALGPPGSGRKQLIKDVTQGSSGRGPEKGGQPVESDDHCRHLHVPHWDLPGDCGTCLSHSPEGWWHWGIVTYQLPFFPEVHSWDAG